jgi:hypothetical protein
MEGREMKGMIARFATVAVCALVIAALPAISSATTLSALKGHHNLSDAAKLHSSIQPQRR